MLIQRTVTIRLPSDPDLRETLRSFRDVENALTHDAFNSGTPLSAIPLQRCSYHRVKGKLSSQMTISAIRMVAGNYATAVKKRSNAIKIEERRRAKYAAKGWAYRERRIKSLSVCRFEREAAMFLVGKRGRDADFRKDGMLSIWTVAGRKRLAYQVVAAHQSLFEAAQEIDSVTVLERNGEMLGRVAITLVVADPVGAAPVGVDLNETNALVAVDADGRELFISGHQVKIKNRRTANTTSRLQRKFRTRKAEGKSTRSVRRTLKRLNGRRRRRTADFARTTASRLVQWSPLDAVLVFEDLSGMGQVGKETTKGTALRGRLSLWQHSSIRRAVVSKAEANGRAIAFVSAAYTSQNCSRCGLRGIRKQRSFHCPHCGHAAHADVNAAINIRLRFVQSRLDAPPSVGAEALSRKGSRAS